MILSISALRQNLDALINSSGHSASPPPTSSISLGDDAYCILRTLKMALLVISTYSFYPSGFVYAALAEHS